jgi:hypothetical protein
MKMINLEDFEGRACRAVRRRDPSKGGQDRGVWRLAPFCQTVGLLFGTLGSKLFFSKSIKQFHAELGQFSSYKNGTPHFGILEGKGHRSQKCRVAKVYGHTYITAPCSNINTLFLS